MKVNLQGVAETLLIPYYARVYGSRFYKNKFYDKYALEVFEKIDYDFSKFEKGKMSIWGCLSRSKILDREAKKIIDQYPNITCISIGCGFDTRFNRIDNGEINWYGIDFPEVIDLRNRIFLNKKREKYLGANALEESWAEQIKEEKEVLIILEGILMYFKEEEIKNLFKILKKYFPNAIILAEFSRPGLIKYQKKHDTLSKVSATLYWGISKSKDIEKIAPEVKFIEEWNLTKGMIAFSPFFMILIYPIIYKVNNTIVKLKIK
ncbi:class I SAM-dependent methyltransferase [Fusobacterium russii]|uniref:class I SAM-dependent methyltransferase n=1 Tax=Fusobacterium russii TaxID=854 RepID=UPI0003A90814|nr:class I SAM-dependent methyltransferase [Fusobacterium russii]